MPKLTRYAGKSGGRGDLLVFTCPGCNYDHPFDSRWAWNGSMDKPTFAPSLLILGAGESPRCHSFVRDGLIQFLSDCGHELKGKTVELPEWGE